MSDVELCDHCGVTLHAPEHDIEREDTAGHECVPMLRKEIERLREAIEAARERLVASLFTNSEHSQAIHILEKALKESKR